MNTTKRSSKKKTTMRGGGGFMCHSAGATAVHTCTVSDPRSVIVPRSSNHRIRHHHHQFDHTTLLFKNAKYSKLVHDHSKRSASTSTSGKDISVITPNHHNHRRSTALVSSIIKKDEGHNPSSRDHHKSSKLIMQQQQQQPITTPNSSVTTTSSADQVFQVVVMRVSIHCQGCAGKLKKHLSKMEGVTSFSIDLETKRVTVMGHVSPVAVLESISKVKRAEFWPCN